MNLEKEISQKEFKSEYHKLFVNLIFTFNWISNYQTKIFNKYDLTPQQYNILRILRGQNNNPVSINLLKERMLDKMSDASRLVERLRVKGLVKRTLCEKDRRRVEVSITQKGLEKLEKLDFIDDQIQNKLSSLSKEEAEQLNFLLDKLRG